MLKTLLFLVVLIFFQSVSALNYASKNAWLIAEKNKQNTDFGNSPWCSGCQQYCRRCHRKWDTWCDGCFEW